MASDRRRAQLPGDSTLELGGKDPAYVRADANLPFAIENIVDGGFFNSGQSCCGMERVYVHEAVYDAFVEGAVATVNAYKLGSPTDPATTLGPAGPRLRREVRQGRRSTRRSAPARSR